MVKLTANTDGPGIAAAAQRFVPPSNIGGGEIGSAIIGGANLVEQKLRAREIERDQAQAQQDRVNGARISAEVNEYGARRFDELVEAWDGQSSLSDGIETDLKTEMDRHLESVESTDLRAYLSERFTTVRSAHKIKALGIETEKRRAHAFSGVNETIARNQNAILTDPSLFESARKDLPELVTALPEALQEAAYGEALNKIGGAYVTALNREDPQALKALLSGEDLDGVLTPQQKSAALSANKSTLDAIDRDAKRAIKEQKAEEKRQARERERDAKLQRMIDGVALNADLDDHYASLQGSGVGLSAVSFKRVLETQGPVAAARFAQKEKEARAVFTALDGISAAPPAEIAEKLSALAPKPGQSGFDDQQKIYSAASKLARDTLKAREEDPVRAVLQNNPSLLALRAQLQDEGLPDEDRAALLKNSVEAGLQAQADIGIAPDLRRVMTENEAKGFVSQFAVMPPDQRRDLINSISAYGAHQSKVMGELVNAGLPPQAEAMWSLSHDPLAQTTLSQALGNIKELDNAFDSKAKRDIEDRTREALEPLFATFGSSPDAPRQIDNYTDAMSLIAKQRVLSGESPGKAAKQAAAVLTSTYDFQGSYRVPQSQNPDAVHDATRDIINTLGLVGDVGLTPEATGRLRGQTALPKEKQWWAAPGDSRLSEDHRRREYGNLISRYGRWVTNEDESGLALMINSGGLDVPVLNRHGSRISLDWNTLTNIGADQLDMGGVVFTNETMTPARIAEQINRLGAE